RLEEMLGRKLAPLGLGDEATFGDADQRIVRLEVLAPSIERLVAGDERDGVPVSEIEQARLDLFFLRPAVALQLDVEPVAKQRGEPCAARRRKLGLARDQGEVERSA